ncbi:MAG: hypothetical protein JSW41_05650 [Candidatus Aenigmatarchaeota archaeon]|nr:MAG: hypothetical protein JSW41_05650 [Candidatus Aenigmarchaeota archaeon]
METWTRKEIKADPVLRQLLELIKHNHKVPDYTVKELIKHNHPEMCQQTSHFAILPGKNQVFISYEMSTWYKHPGEFLTRVDSVTVYEDFMEYEKARQTGFKNAPPDGRDIPNIN